MHGSQYRALPLPLPVFFRLIFLACFWIPFEHFHECLQGQSGQKSQDDSYNPEVEACYIFFMISMHMKWVGLQLHSCGSHLDFLDADKKDWWFDFMSVDTILAFFF